MPRLMDNEVTPIIIEIPEKVFDSIIKPVEKQLQVISFLVQVDYYIPIREQQKCIIYDSTSKNDVLHHRRKSNNNIIIKMIGIF